MTPPDTCKVCGCPPPRTLPGNADDYSPCAACSGVHIAYWRDRVKGLQADLDVERAALTEACNDVDELTDRLAAGRDRAAGRSGHPRSLARPRPGAGAVPHLP